MLVAEIRVRLPAFAGSTPSCMRILRELCAVRMQCQWCDGMNPLSESDGGFMWKQQQPHAADVSSIGRSRQCCGVVQMQWLIQASVLSITQLAVLDTTCRMLADRLQGVRVGGVLARPACIRRGASAGAAVMP